MPLYDFECEACGEIIEAIMGVDEVTLPCPICAHQAKRIISCRGVNVANQDADWIRSVLEVVDKRPTAGEHCKLFLKEPTRQNYRAWMKGEGVRPLESNEKSSEPSRTELLGRLKTGVLRRRMERHKIIV